jgi:hypothetical protein
MQFKVKIPCAECPFRKNIRPFLTAGRAAQIAGDLSDDHHWFACHHTTGPAIKTENQSQCAGSMGVLWKMHRPNIAMRLAIHFKLITLTELNRIARHKIYPSLSAFVRAHRNAR